MTPSTFDKMYKCQYDLEAIDERLNQININFWAINVIAKNNQL